MFDLPVTNHDDPEFIELVVRILNGATQCYKPKEIYVVEIEGWFDYRWRAFSGKFLGAVGTRNDTLTIPPFNPSRVISQLYYRVEEVSGAYSSETVKPLYSHQPSSSNINNFLHRTSTSGLFI